MVVGSSPTVGVFESRRKVRSLHHVHVRDVYGGREGTGREGKASERSGAFDAPWPSVMKEVETDAPPAITHVSLHS